MGGEAVQDMSDIIPPEGGTTSIYLGQDQVAVIERWPSYRDSHKII